MNTTDEVMDYEAIKVMKKAGATITEKDYDDAIKTERHNVTSYALALAEAEAALYRLWNSPAIKTAQAARDTRNDLSLKFFDHSRHLAKLLNMKFELTNPEEAAQLSKAKKSGKTQSKSKLCPECMMPIEKGDKLMQGEDGVYHISCMKSDPEDTDEENDWDE